MTNKEIAHLLRQMAAALEVKNVDRFRLRAYENAADSIEHETTEIRDIWEQKKLETIPGIGPTLSSHLDELFKTGKVKHFIQETKSLPQAMFDILGIPGIGAKTAYKLSRELKLPKGKKAIASLKTAAEQGKIRNIEGFAEQSEQDILAGIAEQEKRGSRILLATAEPVSEKILDYMKQAPVKVIEPLGSLRRRNATVGDIDLAAATLNPQAVLEHFVKYPDKKTILAKGGNTARIILKNNIQVDLKTQTPDKFGALLQHFTGSKNHNVHLRELAVKKGLSLSEYGIKVKKTGKTEYFATEAAFYQRQDMAWIPPELREDTGEIERALKNKLPNLVKLEDIQGDLHTHSNYDWISSHDYGKDSFKEIINAAVNLGYEYIGLGDHNPSRSQYTEKQIIDLLKRRKEAIEKLRYSYEKNKTTRGIFILNVLEVDILSDGGLALPDKALSEL
ncbi:MAG: DNA polymerase III, partial [Candidatus Chisholmbacteria bacterium]|nr:DNA polymerase III [Candidatus Chisholmbacteria bacterium]